MDLVHVSSKGQIVIPTHIRQRLKLAKGARMLLVQQKDTLVLKKEDDDTILTPAEKRQVDRARREFREGKGITHEELKRKLGFT